MNRRDLLLAGGGLILLAVAVVRLAVPDRSRLRAVSVEGIELAMGRIDAGQTVTREAAWEPPEDVYVLGWNASLGMARGDFDADLLLYDVHTKTAVFATNKAVLFPGTVDGAGTAALPAGTGYRALRGRPLSFRCRITNNGSNTIEPHGTKALVYFVPVEGN